MAIEPSTTFPHRLNPDGTWDSICTKCYLTIATEKSEEALAAAEQRHDCYAAQRERYLNERFAKSE